MIDPDVIDQVIAEYFDKRVDYEANSLQENYPDGEDVEVFSFDALFRAWNETKTSSEREHVTPYIRKNIFFKKVNVANKIDLGRQRWTLDEPCDLEKLSVIFDALYKKDPFFIWRMSCIFSIRIHRSKE